MGWQGLSNINEVEPLSEDDQRVLQDVREVLKRHGALERFGVTLLHSHFDLGPDELLVETVDHDNRTLTVRPRSSEDVAGELVPTSWRLDAEDGEPRVLTYCHRTSGGIHAI